MVYECEYCETILTAGLTACPHCGEAFDDPVPDDATLPISEAAALPPSELSQPVTSRHPARSPRMAMGLLAVVVLLGAGWFGIRSSLKSAYPPAVNNTGSQAIVATDLQAHPAYAASMTGLVSKLQSTGIGAQWPAFGSSDTLLITPPIVVGGQRATWNSDLYKQLAQGIYGSFWEKRYESGFSDRESTTCFVLVSDASGNIVATDLMGNVE